MPHHTPQVSTKGVLEGEAQIRLMVPVQSPHLGINRRYVRMRAAHRVHVLQDDWRYVPTAGK